MEPPSVDYLEGDCSEDDYWEGDCLEDDGFEGDDVAVDYELDSEARGVLVVKDELAGKGVSEGNDHGVTNAGGGYQERETGDDNP